MSGLAWSVIALAGLALLLAGCGNIGTKLANLPVRFSDEQVNRDVSYGPEAWQKLDLYYPTHVQNEPLPVILFFYGGRWTDGSKAQYAFVADRFTKLGYAVAIADYAKYPHVKFPTFVEDAAAAIAYLHAQADKWQLDAGRLFVLGHSSGAHIGALAITDPHYLRQAGCTRACVAGFAGLAGPYAFTPEEEDLKDMFGPPERYPQMQVPNFVDGKQPPMLLLYGDKDDIVGEFNHQRLAQMIEQTGGQVTVKRYANLNHISLAGSLSWIYDQKAPVTDDIDTFFQQY